MQLCEGCCYGGYKSSNVSWYHSAVVVMMVDGDGCVCNADATIALEGVNEIYTHVYISMSHGRICSN